MQLSGDLKKKDGRVEVSSSVLMSEALLIDDS